MNTSEALLTEVQGMVERYLMIVEISKKLDSTAKIIADGVKARSFSRNTLNALAPIAERILSISQTRAKLEKSVDNLLKRRREAIRKNLRIDIAGQASSLNTELAKLASEMEAVVLELEELGIIETEQDTSPLV